MLNRQKIFDKITYAAQVVSPTDTDQHPTTSGTNLAESGNSVQYEQLLSTENNYDDHFDDFCLDDDPETSQPCHFLNKPPISVFSDEKENQPPKKKVKIEQLYNPSSDLHSPSTSNINITNKPNFESTSSKNENKQFTNKNPNVKYDNCVFHGNIINNFYYCTTKNTE